MKALVTGALLLVLVGCGSTQPATKTVLESEDSSPAQIVFAAQADYAALLAAANAYEDLPRCSETQADPCSKQNIVEILWKADNAANASLTTAQGIVRTASSDDLKQQAADAALASLDAWEAVLRDNGIWEGN